MKKTLLVLLALLCTPFALRADTLYVTPTGAGNKDGSSWANAFAGIQAAVDAADAAYDADGTLHDILVGDGTYTRVVVSRNFALQVRSQNGAASTIIDGYGTNGCVFCYASGYKTAPTFTGFTLRNGNVLDNSNDRYGGGAAGGTLVDCVIEDCSALWGGGTYKSDTQRCIIRRCTATGNGGACAEEGTHRNTLMCQSTGLFYVTYGVYLYNCTVADNAAPGNFDTIVNTLSRYNCIIWGNTANGRPVAQNDAEDPKLVGDGDYRPRVGSPAIDGGDNDYAAAAGDYDLAGNARVQNGTIDRGCYEGPGVALLVVTAVADGNGSLYPARVVTNANASVTIRADTSVYNRAVTEWYTNGVLAATGGDSLTVVTVDKDIEVSARFAVLEWWVDGSAGSDSNDGSREHPLKTIQKAVDSAAPYEIINVMPGVYAPIDTTQRHVDIVGVEGAEKTIIDGGGTTRCANLQSSRLTGFTLRNGFYVSTSHADGGGGVKWGTLVECVISNNASNFGGGAYDSHLYRCVITDNSAIEGGGCYDGNATDCLVAYNAATLGGGARGGPYSQFIHCTFAYNRALVCGSIMEAFFYDCVSYRNKSANHRGNYRLFNINGAADSFCEEFHGDPRFVDAENGDFRLRADSPCIDTGDHGRLMAEWDIRGEGFDRTVGAAPDHGCYEGGVEGFVVSVRTDGPGLVSDRTIVVAGGGSATVTATADGRPFVKWLVDGEEAGTTPTLTLDNIDADHVVTACFERRTTNVSGGGAALQDAIEAAKDGDTLVVAPGTYSAIDATGRVLDIVSADGPAKTIIQGKNSLLSKKRAVTFGETMTRPRCTLSGFTVEGGFCDDYRRGGGGVFGGIVSNCVIRGNGAVLGGGGAAYCDLVRCTISNNTSTVAGAGVGCATLENCLVTDNTAIFDGLSLRNALNLGPFSERFGGGGGGIACSAVDHCTIVGNAAEESGGGGAYWTVINDTYVAGNSSDQADGPQNILSCPITGQPWFVCSEEPEYRNSLGYVDAGADDTFVDAANGDYRLKPGSACVDAGDEDYLEDTNRIDLAGAPRWRAKAPDIGCYEIDAVEPTPVSEVSASRSDERRDVEVSWTRTRGSEWYEVLRSETERWADAERIGFATNIDSSFVDDTAAYATRYWYWVVSHSDVGDAERDGSASGYWTTPLAMTTASLPAGTSPYSKPLAATGGIAPYAWSVYDAKYQFTTNAESTFSTEGVVRVPYEGYYTSSPHRHKWFLKAMPLPFKFPFGGREYTNVWIHADGVVAFGDEHPNWGNDLYSTSGEDENEYHLTEAQFLSVPAIAPYVHDSYDNIGTLFTKDAATIVWQESYWDGWEGYVVCSLTLYPSGEFDFKYGSSSYSEANAQDHGRYGFSTGNGEGFLKPVGASLAGAPDRCIRYAPAPAWLSARTDQSAAPAPGVAAGVLSAMPPVSTNSEIVVAVKDDDGRASYRRFRLVVTADGSLAGYNAWAAVNSLGADSEEDVTDGQPNLIRYAFDKPTGDFSPITGISFDANGKPVVNVLPLSAAAEGYVTVTVLSTTNLTDWAHAEEVELRVDSNGEIVFPDDGEDAHFYRVKAVKE